MFRKENYIIPILLTIAILTLRRARSGRPKQRRRLTLPELPAPAIVTLSSYLGYSEILALEQLLFADSSLLNECWKEALQSNISNPSPDRAILAPCQLALVRSCLPPTAKQLLWLAESLDRFKAKTLILAGIASHFELKPPYHFFKKPLNTKTMRRKDDMNFPANIISFHAVVAAGQFGQVEWLSLHFIISATNAEMFVCTGNDAQGEHRTLAISDSFVFDIDDIEGAIATNLVRLVERLRAAEIAPLLEVLVQGKDAKSSVDVKAVKAFEERTSAGIVELVEATRLLVDPPHGADDWTNRIVLFELEKQLRGR